MKKLVCSLFGLVIATAYSQTPLAQWNFDGLTLSSGQTNGNTMFSVPADVGSGTASAMHASGTLDFSTPAGNGSTDRKSTRLNSSHQIISYAVFCLKKKIK